MLIASNVIHVEIRSLELRARGRERERAEDNANDWQETETVQQYQQQPGNWLFMFMFMVSECRLECFERAKDVACGVNGFEFRGHCLLFGSVY